jgi:squalene-associated FAD-dependent desaturase
MTAGSGRPVAVIGGGLAGITAALRLADAGCVVTLVESRPRLGGLTHSFLRNGLHVDNGQHVFLRCCTSYRALLDRLGSDGDTTLQSAMDVPVIRAADGRAARLRRDPLPAPLHLARSLATYRALSVPDRLRAVRGALALRGVAVDAPETDEVSFGRWLADHGQSSATVASLWDLVGIATLNARADDASLAVAATVFQIGLLTRHDAADIGWSTVPLQQLHGDPAERALRAGGSTVLTQTKARQVVRSADGWCVVTDSHELVVDAVVVATDHSTAERLLPTDAVPQSPQWSRRLGWSPIVNVHLVLDRRVMAEPFVAGIGTPVQWVFDRTAQSGLDVASGSQYLALSLSAAVDLATEPVAELRALLLPELARLLPGVRHAKLTDFFVTREPRATFLAAPGTRPDRPQPVTRHRGLYVAGAYTATGWPATMESAVRSGDAAASALLAERTTTAEVVAA